MTPGQDVKVNHRSLPTLQPTSTIVHKWMIELTHKLIHTKCIKCGVSGFYVTEDISLASFSFTLRVITSIMLL